MTSTHKINILSFLFFTMLFALFAVSSENPIDPKEAPELIKQNCASLQNNIYQHFQNYSLTMREYEQSNPKELTSKSTGYCLLILENPNDFAHMANIEISANLKSGNWSLRIFKTKINNLTIPLTSWLQEEMDYQIPQITNILHHSYKLIPHWESKTMNVTLLQTVRSKILEKAPGQIDLSMQLIAVPSYEQNYFTWYLKSKESYIGYVNLWMEATDDEKYLQKIELNQNSLAKINLTTVRNGEFSAGTLEIPVLYDSDGPRNSTISQLMTALDFKNTFSNLDELISKTKKYLTTKMPSMEIQPIDKNILENEGYFYQRFKLVHEFSTAEMSIGTALDGQASSYYLYIDYEGNQFAQPFVSLYFRRMDQESLENLFKQNGMEKLFRTVYEDVVEMFRNGYDQFIQQQKVVGSNQSYEPLVEFNVKGSYGGNDQMGLKNNDIKLNYEKDKTGKINVILTSQKKSIEYKESFHFDKYNSQFVLRLIENFFLRYGENLNLV